MKNAWLLSMIWIAIASLVFGWVRHVSAQEQSDAKRMINDIRPYLEGNRTYIFKHTGYYGACEGGSADRLLFVGNELAAALGLPQTSELGASNGHSVYSVQAEPMESAAWSLIVAAPQGSPACYAVFRMEAHGDASIGQLLKWQEQADTRFKGLAFKGQWNVMAQGSLRQQTAQENSSPEAAIERLSKALEGKIAEQYADDGTYSVSLTASDYQTSVQSGGQSVHLQIALHRDSHTGVWRLTAGTPVITMEY